MAQRRCVPLTLHLELTYRSNARCVHCFQDRSAASREMTLAEWCAVLDQARGLGALTLSLSGGEALLSPHFFAVGERARQLGYAVRIFTNGLLLDRETVRRIAGLSPLAVEVSVFALRPDRHDAVTGVQGSLSRTLRGLFRLHRARVPLVIKCPLLAGCAADHAEVRTLAERLGAGLVFDPMIHAAADGRHGPTRCRGDDAAVESYFADPATQASDPPNTAPIGADRPPCGMARSMVVVAPDGEVHACPVLLLSAGNVRDRPLDVIWRESPLFVKLRSRRVGDLKDCAACPRSGYCGRCSALALLEDGDLDGPSSRACKIAELRERAWGSAPPPGIPALRPRSRLRVLQ
jgi:radical SAM protein with 4Fe4S-binding SPASM domain